MSENDGKDADYGSGINSVPFMARLSSPPRDSLLHALLPSNVLPGSGNPGRILRQHSNLPPHSSLPPDRNLTPLTSTGRVRRMSLPSAPIVDPAVMFGPSMYSSGRSAGPLKACASMQSIAARVYSAPSAPVSRALDESHVMETMPILVSRSEAPDSVEDAAKSNRLARASLGSMESNHTGGRISHMFPLDPSGRFDSRGSSSHVEDTLLHASPQKTSGSKTELSCLPSIKGRGNSLGMDTAALDNEVKAGCVLNVG